MMKINSNQSGQAIVEFALLATFLIFFISAASILFKLEWKRSWCAYEAFETTHSHLTGRFRIPTLPVEIQENENQVEGTAQCGTMRERVVLPKLETATWKR